MDRLWAPWRIGYVRNFKKRQRGCLFCRSLKSKTKNYIFINNKYSFAMLNTFPYNNGHTMISPKRHISNIQQLSAQEASDIFKTLKQAFGLLDKVLSPQGYNLGANIGECSGAGVVGHLHLHIVPRWKADTNFMSVISNVKVICQSLDELYIRLKDAYAKTNKRIRR